ncbi:hypothetical protein ES707_19969 [subsurface metagenome]
MRIILYYREVKMKKIQVKKISKHSSNRQEAIRTFMRLEGKFLHGTRGKPTHGPRGNKR